MYRAVKQLLLLIPLLLLFSCWGDLDPIPEEKELKFTLSNDSIPDTLLRVSDTIAVGDTFELYGHLSFTVEKDSFSVVAVNNDSTITNTGLLELTDSITAVDSTPKHSTYIGSYRFEIPGTYNLEVTVEPSTDGFAPSKVSRVVYVGYAPTLDSSSKSNDTLTLAPSAGCTLSVIPTSIGDHTYQWYKDSAEIPLATNGMFIIPSLVETDSGSYYCIVETMWGADTSGVTKLNVISNNPPAWNMDTVVIQVFENELIAIDMDTLCNDEDQDPLTYRVIDTTLPFIPVAIDSTNALLSKQTTFDHAGVYFQNIVVSDGIAEDSAIFKIEVTNVNRVPVWDTLSFIPAKVENSILDFVVDTLVKDLDGTTPVITLDSVTFNGVKATDEFLVEGKLSKSLDFNSAGTYVFFFSAIDSEDPTVIVGKTLSLAVRNVNRPPYWDTISVVPANVEGGTLDFMVDSLAKDHDGTAPAVTLDSVTLNGVKIEGSFHSDGKLVKALDYNASGTYLFYFKATDAEDNTVFTAKTLSLVVGNVNRPPYWDTISTINTHKEGQTLDFVVNTLAKDLDLTTPVVTLDSVTLNGIKVEGEYLVEGKLIKTLGFNDEGVYQFYLLATDAEDVAISTPKILALTVENENRAPYWDDLNTIPAIAEGAPLNFPVDVLAKDLDGTTPVVTLDSVTLNGTKIEGQFHAEGYLRMETNNNSSGVYLFYLNAFDGIESTPKTLTLKVGDVNLPPYWDTTSTISEMNENNSLDFGVQGLAHDDDGTSPLVKLDSVTFNGVKIEGEFLVEGKLTKAMDFNSAGTYLFYLSAVDAIDADISVDKTLSLIVKNVNRAPVIQREAETDAVEKGSVLSIDFTAVDDDGDTPVYTLLTDKTTLPGVDDANLDGATFTWNCTVEDVASYTVAVEAKDNNGGFDTLTVTVNTNSVPFVLTVKAEEFGTVMGGAAEKAVDVLLGGTAEISAVAHNGYFFNNWVVLSGTAAIADANSATTTISGMTANASVLARFVKDTEVDVLQLHPDSPQDSARIEAKTVSFKVNASDRNGIKSISYELGGIVRPADGTDGVYDIPGLTLEHGYNTITVIATDNSIHENKDTLTVNYFHNITPEYPEVLGETPANGADKQSIAEGVTLRWNAVTSLDADDVVYTVSYGVNSLEHEITVKNSNTVTLPKANLNWDSKIVWNLKVVSGPDDTIYPTSGTTFSFTTKSNDTGFDKLELAPATPESNSKLRDSLFVLKIIAEDIENVASVTYTVNGGAAKEMTAVGGEYVSDTIDFGVEYKDYNFKVIATDGSHNSNKDSLELKYSFDPAPIIGSVLAPVTDAANVENLGGVSFTWNETTDKNDVVRYALLFDDGKVFGDTTATTMVISGLEGGSTYNWRLRITAGDSVTYLPDNVAYYNFNTLNHPTEFPDVIPTISTSIKDPVSYTLDITDDEGIDKIKYYVDNKFVGQNSGGAITLILDTVTTTAKDYTLRIDAIDYKGDITSKTGKIVVTNNAPIITSIPDTTVYVGTTSDSIELYMSATDEDPTLTYKWKNGNITKTTPNGKLKVSVTGLAAPQSYEFIGSAEDDDGNISYCTTTVSYKLNVKSSNIPAIPDGNEYDIRQVGDRYVVCNRTTEIGTPKNGSWYKDTVRYSNDLHTWYADRVFEGPSQPTDPFAYSGFALGYMVDGDYAIRVEHVPNRQFVFDHSVKFSPHSAGDDILYNPPHTINNFNNVYNIIGYVNKSPYSSSFLMFGIYETNKDRNNYTYQDSVYLWKKFGGSWSLRSIRSLEMLPGNTPYHVDEDTILILHGRKNSRNLSKYLYSDENLAVVKELTTNDLSIDGNSHILKVKHKYYIVNNNKVYIADFENNSIDMIATINGFSKLKAAVTLGDKIICYTDQGQFEIAF